jgi:hypothetical protein
MGYSRRQFIEAAFEELGLAEYTFDMQPEQYQGAARRLDAMLMTWNGRGPRLGPNISSTAAGADLAQDMGLPDIANEAVILNLAVALAPSYGKTVSPDTKAGARFALNTVFARFAKPIPQRFPYDLPLGAGNKPWRFGNPFVLPEAEPLLANTDSTLEIDQ